MSGGVTERAAFAVETNPRSKLAPIANPMSFAEVTKPPSLTPKRIARAAHRKSRAVGASPCGDNAQPTERFLKKLQVVKRFAAARWARLRGYLYGIEIASYASACLRHGAGVPPVDQDRGALEVEEASRKIDERALGIWPNFARRTSSGARGFGDPARSCWKPSRISAAAPTISGRKTSATFAPRPALQDVPRRRATRSPPAACGLSSLYYCDSKQLQAAEVRAAPATAAQEFPERRRRQ